MRRYIGAAFAIAALVTGCGGGDHQQNGGASHIAAGTSKPYAELHWGVTSLGDDLEFRKQVSNDTTSLERLVVQSLVEFRPDGKVTLGLAESVAHPNATTYIYKLRPGVRFSDGRPLTVGDVVYSLDLNKGKESQTISYWKDVSSVTAVGDSAVMVKLKRPNVLWQEYMAETGAILEKAAAEKVGEKKLGTLNGLPIGTGPWKFDSFTPEVDVKYSRNPYWTGPRPPAERITVSNYRLESALALALRSGAIDGAYTFFDPKLFVNIPHTQLLKAPSPEVEFVAMNTQAPPFNDVHVRRAVAYAANVRGMIEAFVPAGYAEEAQTVASTALFATAGSPSQVSEAVDSLPKYEFNLAAARRELAKSRYPHGFATTGQVPIGQPVTLGIAEVLATDLRKIGITMHIHEHTLAEYPAIFAGRFSLIVEGYPAFYPDPEALFGLLLPSTQISPPGPGFNMARFTNAEVDRLMSRQREVEDAARRLKMMVRIASIVAAEAPYRPLYSIKALAGLSDAFAYPTFSQWSILFTPWAMEVRKAA